MSENEDFSLTESNLAAFLKGKPSQKIQSLEALIKNIEQLSENSLDNCYEHIGELIKDPNPQISDLSLDLIAKIMSSKKRFKLSRRETLRSILPLLISSRRAMQEKAEHIFDILTDKLDLNEFATVLASILFSQKVPKAFSGSIKAAIILVERYGPRFVLECREIFSPMERALNHGTSSARQEVFNFYVALQKFAGDAGKPYIDRLGKATQKEISDFVSVGINTLDVVDRHWVDQIERADPENKVAQLETLLKMFERVKLEALDDQHLVSVLPSLIEDKNPQVQIMAMKVLASLARGMDKHFKFGANFIKPLINNFR